MAGGACVAGYVWQGGMCGRWGCSWQGACMAGACVAGGHAWQGDMHRMHAPRYCEIWSMSGRYVAYWNAFLSQMFLPFL